MKINAIATTNGLTSLTDHVKDDVKKFIILGDAGLDNVLLAGLVNGKDTCYEQIKDYIVYQGRISKAYYDGNGILTFELTFPYDNGIVQYIYGVGLLDENNVLISISKTPKFIKTEGVGGTLVYKVAVSGEPGEIVFSDGTGVLFASDSEYLDGITRNRAIDPFQLKRANVAQAEKLEHGRKINGVEFDGTKDITIKAEAAGGNADTVGGIHAWQLQTLAEAGNSHRQRYLMYCQWNKDRDHRWRLYVADRTGKQNTVHPSGIKVDYAESASRLQTSRKINGMEFDGTKDITVTARANGGNADTLGGINADGFVQSNTTVVHNVDLKNLAPGRYWVEKNTLDAPSWYRYGWLDVRCLGERILQFFTYPPHTFYRMREWNGTWSTWQRTIASVPVGFVYTQYPGQPTPAELFGPNSGTWENISTSYAGRFFRAEGGKAAEFDSIDGQKGAAPNITGTFTASQFTGYHNKAYTATGAFYINNEGKYAGNTGSNDLSAVLCFNAQKSNDIYGAADEIRPVNVTIRLWKRIS